MKIRPFLALAFAGAILSCGNNSPAPKDSDGGSEDASVDGGADAGATLGAECVLGAGTCSPGQSCMTNLLEDGGMGTRCVEGLCGLVTQDCGVGFKCTYVGTDAGFVRDCVDDGTADEGQPCTGTPTSNTCKAGLICAVQQGADGGASSVCAKFCNTSSDCTSPSLCYVLVSVAGSNERPLVCAPPPSSCDLFAQDCAQLTDACYPSGTGSACFPQGNVTDGANCQYANDCLKGSACTGSAGSFVCHPLCGTQGTPACASGTCSPLTGIPDAGVCK